MNKKQFILIYLLFCAVFSEGKKKLNFGSLRDDLQIGSYFAEELTKGIASGNILDSLKNVFGLVSQIHPIVGAISGALYFCLSIFGAVEPTEDPLLVAVRDGVAVVCRKLDRISDAIRDAGTAINFELRGLSLEHQVDDIEGMLLLQQQLLQRGDNESLVEFINSCMLTRVYEKPFWFAKVLTAPNPNNFKHLIIQQRDATQLNEFYQRVISMFFQAAILSTSCTVARYRGKSNETVQFYVDRKGDHAQFMLQQIYDVMKRDTQFLTSNFVLDSFTDVVEAAKRFKDENIEMPFEYLNYTLNRKYNYRTWMVIVYGNADTKGLQSHALSPDKDNELLYEKTRDCDGYFRNFIRFHGTNYAIGTPNNCPLDNYWRKKAIFCVQKKISEMDNCGQMKKFLDCLEFASLKYLVAGCVHEKYYLGVGDGNLATAVKPGMVLFVFQ